MAFTSGPDDWQTLLADPVKHWRSGYSASRLARSDFPDFNDPNKLGEGDAMVKRLENLIGIFVSPAWIMRVLRAIKRRVATANQFLTRLKLDTYTKWCCNLPKTEGS